MHLATPLLMAAIAVSFTRDALRPEMVSSTLTTTWSPVVGAIVGKGEGSEVGKGVGNNVGAGVAAVGAADGAGIGAAVGAADGAGIGAAVGTHASHPAQLPQLHLVLHSASFASHHVLHGAGVGVSDGADVVGAAVGWQAAQRRDETREAR